MPRPRYPSRDANQSAITEEVESYGLFVQDVSSLPVAKAGVDMYVWGIHAGSFMPKLFGFEIKTPKGRLNKNEAEFFEKVDRAHCSDLFHVARCAQDVLIHFGITIKEEKC